MRRQFFCRGKCCLPQHLPRQLPIAEANSEGCKTISKVAGLQPATLLKMELLHRYFSFVFTADVEQLFCRTPTSGCFLILQYPKF